MPARSRRSRNWYGRTWRSSPSIEPVHLEFFGTLEKIADAKAEIFSGVEPGGAAVLNRDNRPIYATGSSAARPAGIARIVSFGEHEDADARLNAVSLQANSSTVEANILGQAVTYKLGAPGRHLVHNSLAVLAAASLAGADLALAALALAQSSAGRWTWRAQCSGGAGRHRATD